MMAQRKADLKDLMGKRDALRHQILTLQQELQMLDYDATYAVLEEFGPSAVKINWTRVRNGLRG